MVPVSKWELVKLFLMKGICQEKDTSTEKEERDHWVNIDQQTAGRKEFDQRWSQGNEGGISRGTNNLTKMTNNVRKLKNNN